MSAATSLALSEAAYSEFQSFSTSAGQFAPKFLRREMFQQLSEIGHGKKFERISSNFTTTTTTERLNSLCIKRHVLKGGINDFYRVKSEKKFQARQMLQEHLINQVQERLISKEDTRL